MKARRGSGLHAHILNITAQRSDLREKVNVTGFDIFVLCYKFGRRARAMVNSLARQVTSPSIHLTVFYNRDEDLDLLRQGASAGPTHVPLKFIHVNQEVVMQRAIHFSRILPSALFSHTVFMDVDLWFPPTFWREYALSLARELPGYWSCRVLNIPYYFSEERLNSWEGLTAQGLTALCSGTRHDAWKGAVGHFQCIPSGMVGYPPDQIMAVNRADESFATASIGASADKREERRIGPVHAFHFDHPRCWTGSLIQL